MAAFRTLQEHVHAKPSLVTEWLANSPFKETSGLCYETRGKEFELCSSRRSGAFIVSGLSHWPRLSLGGGREGIALRFILLIPSRWPWCGWWPAGGRAGLFPGCGGWEREGRQRRVHQAGALAELAVSTCEPWAARKSSPTPRSCWRRAESYDDQAPAFAGELPCAPRAATGM